MASRAWTRGPSSSPVDPCHRSPPPARLGGWAGTGSAAAEPALRHCDTGANPSCPASPGCGRRRGRCRNRQTGSLRDHATRMRPHASAARPRSARCDIRVQSAIRPRHECPLACSGSDTRPDPDARDSSPCRHPASSRICFRSAACGASQASAAAAPRDLQRTFGCRRLTGLPKRTSRPCSISLAHLTPAGTSRGTLPINAPPGPTPRIETIDSLSATY